MRTSLLRTGVTAAIKKTWPPSPMYKCGCSVYGRPGTSDETANSWESLCFYWIHRCIFLKHIRDINPSIFSIWQSIWSTHEKRINGGVAGYVSNPFEAEKLYWGVSCFFSLPSDTKS